VLTGDEIGILLADQALRTTDGPGRLVVSSIASSRMVGALAAAAGADWLTTPPGFKWIARAADARPGVRFTFGYEEALGYAVHDLVREKDALTAAAAFAVLVADLLAVGETVTARLDELDRRFGVHATARWSLHLPGADGARQLAHAIARLAADPPDELAGRRVRGMRQLAGDQLVELELDRDARVVVRPSGTEPKLKVHVEVVSSPADGLRLETARRAAHEEADAIRASMVAWLTEP
jgi:phosphomannomutase